MLDRISESNAPDFSLYRSVHGIRLASHQFKSLARVCKFMPINATAEYFKAEQRFSKARTTEEKILALEEMIRELPKHKGTENVLAQLRSKLAKLKKQAAKAKEKGRKEIGVKKEGEAQICLLGKTMSGKSWILQKLTEAKPQLASHPYTTTKPQIGMMNWRGVKIQLVEIPAMFDVPHMSVCRTADAIALVAKSEADKAELLELLDKYFIRKPHVFVNAWSEDPESIRQRLGSVLGMIIVYTKSPRGLSAMALPAGANVRAFAERIHKDFIKHFRFAFLWRTINGKKRKMQIGLDYVLQDGDVVELHMK